MMQPAASPVVRSVIAGRPAPGCSASKPRATGPIFADQNTSLFFPGDHQPHTHRRVRPVHRPGRLCLEQRPALREGRCCGDRTTAYDLRTAPGNVLSPTPRRSTPAGAARSAPASNLASRRTGRLRVEYDHMFMGSDQTYNFTTPRRGWSLRNRPHPSGRRSRHRSRELPLGWPGHREVLMLPEPELASRLELEKAGLAPAFFVWLVRAVCCHLPPFPQPAIRNKPLMACNGALEIPPRSSYVPSSPIGVRSPAFPGDARPNAARSTRLEMPIWMK